MCWVIIGFFESLCKKKEPKEDQRIQEIGNQKSFVEV
jgi:hypothetical protein